MCKSGIIPTRAVIACMIFSACLISYMLRVNISINLIAMVEPSTSAQGGSGQVAECVTTPSNNSDGTHEKVTAPPDYGIRYEWDSKVQGLILGSYFWGYTVASFAGGFFAERFGPTRVIGLTTLLSAVLTVLTPLGANWHYGFVIADRVILGILGGVVYPSLHCLISKWAPPNEKGKFTGALLGGTLGTVVTWPMLGAIMEAMGWSWAFFIPGGLALFWCILWFFLVADTPDKHTRITDEEKFYIIKSHGDSISSEKRIPPYKDMFFSLPFWALIILHFGNLWGLYLLMTAGPKFMSEVLGFNLGHSGVLAALPYLARMIFGFIFGLIGDCIRKSNKLSVTCIRKSFIFFSHIVPGLFLIGQTLIGCDATLAVVFLTMALGMNGASTLTNLQNSQDLAPNFAGTIYGIINSIGGTTGFITPILTGYITAENSGLHEWHIIFLIGASVYIGCGLIYCITGSGEEQHWNNNAKNTAPPTSGLENDGFERNEKYTESENTKV